MTPTIQQLGPQGMFVIRMRLANYESRLCRVDWRANKCDLPGIGAHYLVIACSRDEVG